MIFYELLPLQNMYEVAEEMSALAASSNEQVTTVFNDIPVLANPGDNAESILAAFDAEVNRRRKERMASPEGQREREEFRKRAEAAAREPLKNFHVKDVELWESLKHEYRDYYYGLVIIRYAARWANLVEQKLQEGSSFKDIISQTSDEADVEKISGGAYGLAVNVLTQCWEHGEELRVWHNRKYGYDGDGVVNPAALLTD